MENPKKMVMFQETELFRISENRTPQKNSKKLKKLLIFQKGTCKANKKTNKKICSEEISCLL